MALGAALCGALLTLSGGVAAATPPVAVYGVGYGHYLGSSKLLTVEPTQATPTGDGTLWWEHLHWSDWGSPTATALGGLGANNCRPNCAQGHFTHYPEIVAAGKLTASGLRTQRCDHRLVRVYTRYTFSARQVQHGLKTHWRMHLTSGCQLRWDD